MSVVSFRNLGQWGRFGNAVFEYAFVKIFGKRHGLDVQTGWWVGQKLFGANDPIAVMAYPQHMESTYALKDSKLAHLKECPGDIDICGVFQYHTAYYRPHKAYFRKLFEPVAPLRTSLDDVIKLVMKERGAKTLVVLHLRRGDYGFGMFFVPPNQWYLDWLAALWPTLDKPLLYIASDEPGKVVGDFAAYAPITVSDLAPPLQGAEYYTDFYVISQAHHVAISNSSFSFAACMLNARRRVTFMRPDLFAGKLVAFEPWDAEPLLHRELGIMDHRQLPQVVNYLRAARQEMATMFSTLTDQQVTVVMSQHFQEGYKTLAGVRGIAMGSTEQVVYNSVRPCLSREQPDTLGPYLAATLFADPATLPPKDLSKLPPAVQEAICQR